MKKNFFIFRHGQTDFNLHQIWQGCHCETELNINGTSQAELLGQRLQDIQLDIIFSSPLKRAVQTALIVAGMQQPPPPVKIISDLREGDFGNAEGQKINVLRARFPDIIDHIIDPTRQTWNLVFPGDSSESKHRIYQRVIRTLHSLALFPADNLGIATHGGVLSALACGLELTNVSSENCALLQLVYDSDNDRFTQIV